MASATATDLITYIGIPLAVAGVVPLIWNIIMAFRIWIELKQSIPARFKRYYTFVIDPAAGRVTVIAYVPSLSFPGLWKTDAEPVGSEMPRTETNESVQSSLARRLTAGIKPPLTSPILGLFRSNKSDTGTSHPLSVTRQRLLGRTWMSMVENFELSLRVPGDFSGVENFRFTVGSDMKASEATPLAMTWAQFVWFALALGAQACDSAWYSGYPCTIRAREGNVIFSIFYQDDALFVRLLPGQEITFCLRRALDWQNIIFERNVLLPLGYEEESAIRLDSVQISPELSTSRYATDQSPIPRNFIYGQEPQHSNQPLAVACRWMLYRYDRREQFGERVPVSQMLLEYRQRTLCYLKWLDISQLLGPRLRRLIGTDDETLRCQRKLGSKFAASAYVEKYCQLRHIISDISNFSGNYARSRQTELNLARDPTQTEQAREMLDEATGRLIKFKAELVQETENINIERSGGGLDWPFPLADRQSFESSVRSMVSVQNTHGYVFGSDSDQAFMKCVVLALADWDDCVQQKWPLNDKILSFIDRVSFAGSTGDRLRKFEYDMRTLEDDLLERGMYAAPSSPVPKLLRKEGGRVFLL